MSDTVQSLARCSRMICGVVLSLARMVSHDPRLFDLETWVAKMDKNTFSLMEKGVEGQGVKGQATRAPIPHVKAGWLNSW